MDWLTRLDLLGVDDKVAAIWAPVFEMHCTPDKFSLGFDELDDFLGQILHESAMLARLEEGLRYKNAARIAAVWPKRFPTPTTAIPYVDNPQALANFVYGGRMGNTDPDDGWRYRGRGLIQITGKDGYRFLKDRMGIDLLAYPDLLAKPAHALNASILWWEGHIPDEMMGDIVKVTKRVNGGTHGLEDRDRLTKLAQSAIGPNVA